WRSGQEVWATLRTPSGEQELAGSDIVVAGGRVPNTRGIGLEDSGVVLESRAYFRVNERLNTTVPGIWAMGDCAGSPQFTHVAGDYFRIVSENLAGGNRSTRDRLVPHRLFSDPPLAPVGPKEPEAQRHRLAVRH